jgi:prephenate dehydrogenase
MARSPFRTVVVVGAGLVGGSFALASARASGVEEVRVWDRDPATRRRAAEQGVGGPEQPDLATALQGADLVLVAVPVPSISQVVAEVGEHVRGGAVVTDVGSVKAQPVLEVERLLERDPRPVGDVETGDRPIRFVGGHPMAGSERSGIEAADGSLFQGATWVLTPTESSDGVAFEQLSAHLRAIGARVLAVEPGLHDRLVAVASHLPQALASTLMDEAAAVSRTTGQAVLSVAAGGFRDVTRIAASDPDLWVGILTENRDAVLWALDGFRDRLSRLRAVLEAGDGEALRAFLARSQEARWALPAKERAGELVDLVVALDDRPGVLAAVTTALGEAGVNIEDLSMRHATEVEAGALLVAVDGHEVAERAQRLLADRGFPAHLEPRRGA